MNPVRGKFRVGMTLVLVTIHFAAFIGAWWCLTFGVSTTAWILAAVLYAVSSLGITVGYHRYFTHQSFQSATWWKYVMAIAGGLASEGPLSEWCANHRQHHSRTDDEYDPHSPFQYQHLLYPWSLIAGFVWAHVGWLFWETARPAGYDPRVPAHDRDVVAWQERHYWLITILGYAIPFLLAGWSGLFLAGFIRAVVHLHVTWMVNSVCHLWGTRPIGPDGRVWDKDRSRNNLLVAFLGMGEGWHGNHHVHPTSAELGYRWYQWDPGKWLIYLLEWLGVVSRVRRFRAV